MNQENKARLTTLSRMSRLTPSPRSHPRLLTEHCSPHSSWPKTAPTTRAQSRTFSAGTVNTKQSDPKQADSSLHAFVEASLGTARTPRTTGTDGRGFAGLTPSTCSAQGLHRLWGEVTLSLLVSSLQLSLSHGSHMLLIKAGGDVTCDLLTQRDKD